MKSFSIKKLWIEYLLILKGFSKADSFFRFILIPIIISSIVVIFIEFDESITAIFGVMISILIGLLFNFVSTFSNKISSNDLKQLAKEKIKRLKLVKETYDSAFISILACLLALVLIFLVVITYKEEYLDTFPDYIKLAFNKLFSFALICVIYHLQLLLILMINRLKTLLDIDVEKELQTLEGIRKNEINEWD